MKRHDWDRSPFVNPATFVPEYIYGVGFSTSIINYTHLSLLDHLNNPL